MLCLSKMTKTGYAFKWNDNITYEPIESVYLDHRQVIVPSDIIECNPETLSSELLQFYKDNILIDEKVSIFRS